MQIKNPTKEAIKNVKIKENVYSIEAEGTLNNVPEEDARYWQENLHKFLIIKKDSLEATPQPETVEIPKPETVEEVKEEVVEEVVVETVEEEPVVEEKPKKKTNKVKK